ncbi:YeiH family protein [Salinarimonas soli]|uniref:Putative sulfate exporter family transporter n=1 Tax=Salinarimonas soli TaxID=1638099 RepID=A0A5B2VFX3_9HYPH|nr:putative sulfate exporter family transporter [Salinarimonas soli]KAA2237209.1 putative sulfate exporter family transporter [Salinarimonas soli]
MAHPSSAAASPLADHLRRLLPGIALALAVAIAATLVTPLAALVAPIPSMVIALLIGIALNGPASRPVFEPGLTWCVKKLLRIAIALLGLRIALLDIWDLGPATALLVLVSMAATLVSGVWFAKALGLDVGYGALAGAATAVCGASATLATSSVVPAYPRKGADVTFTVVAANAVSTLVMVLYPPLCKALGFDPQTTGILLGATIHDMAQVVGSGYAVSEAVGNTAVIVKLFRVFLLLPVVVAIGWWFVRREGRAGEAKVPPPVFALVFLALCLVNSLMPALPGLMPAYAPVKAFLSGASNWGLLVAIAALGLGTSIRTILGTGWRHIAVFAGTTLVLLALVVTGLLVLP